MGDISSLCTSATFSTLKPMCLRVMQVSAIAAQTPGALSLPGNDVCAPFEQLESALRSTIRANAAEIQHLVSTGMFHPGLYSLGFPRCIDYVLLPMLLMLPSSTGQGQGQAAALPHRLHEAIWRCIAALLQAAGPEAFCTDPLTLPAAGSPTPSVPVPRVEDVLLRALHSLQVGDEHTLQAVLHVMCSICAHAAGLPLPLLHAEEGVCEARRGQGGQVWQVLAECEYGYGGWEEGRRAPYHASIPPPLYSLPVLADTITTLLTLAAAVPQGEVGEREASSWPGGGTSMTAAGTLPDLRAGHALYGRSTRLSALSTLCAVLCAVGRPPADTSSPCDSGPGPSRLAPILPGCVTTLLALAAPDSITTSWTRDSAVRTAAVHALSLLLVLALGRDRDRDRGRGSAAASHTHSQAWLAATAGKVYTALTVLARHSLSLCLHPAEHGKELAAHSSLYRACGSACRDTLRDTPAPMLCMGMALLAGHAAGCVGSSSSVVPLSSDVTALHIALLPTLASNGEAVGGTRLRDCEWLRTALPGLRTCQFVLSLPAPALTTLAHCLMAQLGAGRGEGGAVSVLSRAARLWRQAGVGEAQGKEEDTLTTFLTALAAYMQDLQTRASHVRGSDAVDAYTYGHTPSSPYHAAFTRLWAGVGAQAGEGIAGARPRATPLSTSLLLVDHTVVGRRAAVDVQEGEEASVAGVGAWDSLHTLLSTLSSLLRQHEQVVQAAGYNQDAEAEAEARFLTASSPTDTVQRSSSSTQPIPALLLPLLAPSPMRPALLHMTALAMEAYHTVYKAAVALYLQTRQGREAVSRMGPRRGEWVRQGVACVLDTLQGSQRGSGDIVVVECCRLLVSLGSVSGRAFQPFLPSLLPSLIRHSQGEGVSAQAAVACMAYLQQEVMGRAGDKVQEAAVRLLGLPLPLHPSPPLPSRGVEGGASKGTGLWKGVLQYRGAAGGGGTDTAVVPASDKGWAFLLPSPLGLLVRLPDPALALLTAHVDALADQAVHALHRLVERSTASPALLPWGKGLLLPGEQEEEEEGPGDRMEGQDRSLAHSLPASYSHLPGLLSTLVTAALHAHGLAEEGRDTGRLLSDTARGAALPLLRDVASALLQAVDSLAGLGEAGVGVAAALPPPRPHPARAPALSIALDGAAQVVAAVSVVGAEAGALPAQFTTRIEGHALLARAGEGQVGSLWARARLLAGARDGGISSGAEPTEERAQGADPFIQSTEAGLALLPSLTPSALVVAVRVARAAAAHLTACAVDFSRDDGASTEANDDDNALEARMSRLRVSLSSLRAFMVCCTALARHPDTLHPLVADTLPSLLALLPPPGAIRLLPAHLASLPSHSLASSLESWRVQDGRGPSAGATGTGVNAATALPTALSVPLPGTAAAASKEQSTLDQTRAFLRRRAAALLHASRGKATAARGALGGATEHGTLALSRPNANTSDSEGVDSLTALVHATALDALCLLVRPPTAQGPAGVLPGAVCAEIVRVKFSSDVWPRLRAVLLAATLEYRCADRRQTPFPSTGPRHALYAAAIRAVLACAQPSVSIARTGDVDAGSAAQDAAGRTSDPLSDRGPVIPGQRGGLAAPGPASAHASILRPPALGGRQAKQEEGGGESGVARAIGGSGSGALDPHTVVPYGSEGEGQVHVGGRGGGEGHGVEVQVIVEPPILRPYAWEVSALCALLCGKRGVQGSSPPPVLQGLAAQALAAIATHADPAAAWASQARQQ